MTMLAETIDAVIGIDTHRDSHEVEIADPAGKPIATDWDRSSTSDTTRATSKAIRSFSNSWAKLSFPLQNVEV